MTDAEETWQHSQPMPMRGSPCVTTEHRACEYMESIGLTSKVFLFSDSDRAIPGGWGYVASVRPGVPPEGVVAELNAWLRQYPDAWLAVDMRDGVIPPALADIEETFRGFPRTVIILVSDDTKDHAWPRWELVI